MRPTLAALAPPACTALLAGLLLASPALALTPDHRLERVVVPTAESLSLDIDAGKPGYGGSARVALQVRMAADSFQFHAQDLELAKLTLKGPKGAVSLRWSAGPHGVVTARAARSLAPGAYTLDIEFTNQFDTRADALYRLEAAGEHYVCSQFEAISARQAFPCWDEPEFKIPWTLTLRVPRAHVAISNTPAARDTVIGETRTVEFERTPPLPSYLVAIIAGPWEMVPIRGMSVPGNIVCPKGTTALAGLAAEATPSIVAALEKYFGRPYPYRKLDLIAVPEFQAGAMENAGAITYRDRLLLMDPKQAGPSERRSMISITAHEVAHMWFGDLVTMRWWEDLWLNESFASWLGDKITHEVAPEFEMPLVELEGTQRAMARDAQSSTRAIRAKLDAFDDLELLFDELTYQKGQAVLGMLEQWLGPEAFRNGVRSYIAAHEWGNAEAADLWDALYKASERPVTPVASSFLDQGGVPIVKATVYDETTVRLEQTRFCNLGAAPPEVPTWLIPVTLRYSDGNTVRTKSLVLNTPMQTITLDDVKRVTWIHPNADERGYYRWYVERDYRWALVDHAAATMNPRERIGIVNNLAAGIDAGWIPSDEALQMLSRLAADPHPQVVGAVLNALGGARVTFITPDLENAFAIYVRKSLQPALGRIGTAPAAGEPDPARLLRPRLLEWLGRYGRDTKTLERGRAMADAYLRDPSAVDPSLAETALKLAATNGDAARFAEYQRRFETARTPIERARFLNALSAFRDTALVEKALDYSLTRAVRPNEMAAIWIPFGFEPDQQERAFRWMTRRYDAIRERMPPAVLAYLIRFAGGCSLERLESARAFFAPPRRPPGYEIEEPKVADRVKDCATLRTHQGPLVRDYLNSLSAAR